MEAHCRFCVHCGLQVTDDASRIPDHIALISGSVLSEAHRGRRAMHVSCLSQSGLRVGMEDLGLGADAAGDDAWRTARVMCVPVLVSTGDAVAMVLLARAGNQSDFSAEETDFASWLAVLLGRVVEDSDGGSRLEAQLTIAEDAATHLLGFLQANAADGGGAVGVADGGKLGDVLDPYFWMGCFRSETALIAIVHPPSASGRSGSPGEEESRLWCTSCDASKQGVSMVCHALRGVCGSMVVRGDGVARRFEDALSVSEVDRAVDLAGSEFEGRTSLLIVPVMGAWGGVAGVVGVSSTSTVYSGLHLVLLQVH